jgi:dihydroorotate dehydrogenase
LDLLEAQRLLREGALWNRLGFPSQGVARVRDRVAEAPLAEVALAVNLAPHPLTVRSAESEPGFAARARAELFEIARLLHPWAAFFVLNASSPNTPGLRRQLEQQPANFAWGDADGQALYITARTAVYRVRLNIPGIRP